MTLIIDKKTVALGRQQHAIYLIRWQDEPSAVLTSPVPCQEQRGSGWRGETAGPCAGRPSSPERSEQNAPPEDESRTGQGAC